MQKLFAALLVAVSALAQAAGESITVYKDPDCGCCNAWVDHMRESGFTVTAVDSTDMKAIKKRFGVPETMESCHTAVIESSGQVVEGHVPDTVVKKLRVHTSVKGVAAPGMPTNAPGMGKLNGQLVTVDFEGKPFSKD